MPTVVPVMVSEVCCSVVRRSLEIPKSLTLTEPLASSRTFAGLMSRWMIPKLCTADSASQILIAILTAVRWFRVNCSFSLCCRSSPLMYSSTRYGVPSSMTAAS